MKVAQSRPPLCDYTVHGILQPRILEWVVFPFSRGILRTQGSNPGLLHFRQALYQLSHSEAQEYMRIPSPMDLPDSGIQAGSPALQADSLPTELSAKPKY